MNNGSNNSKNLTLVTKW